MNSLFQDEAKIKIYSQLQNALNELEPNSKEECINNIISLIPKAFLSQKDDLMAICQLFAYYSRIVPAKKKGNAMRLFEKIMDQIKSLLSDESSFFWNIFGGLFYFKLWMHEQGLISIDYIILSSLIDISLKTAEYFLPEIIEKEPELFEKELKDQFKIEYTDESISKFKELRRKHFDWIRNSGDFHDEKYKEIENNKLRLALKTDDIDTFQKILSETNMPFDARISESTIENFLRFPMSISLIEFAVEFNSINIFKFLIMNDAKFDNEMNFIAIKSRNYEIVHLLESRDTEKFALESFISAISCWNDEMKEYIMNNYDFNFLEEKDVDKDKDKIANRIADQIFFSSDFMFLESTFIPFLNNNQRYWNDNLAENTFKTFSDNSGFFLREILKSKSIDLIKNSFETVFTKAIQERNTKAVEILLSNYSKSESSDDVDRSLSSAFLIACRYFADVKILKLFCEHPNFKLNSKHWNSNISLLTIVLMSGNIFAIRFIITQYPDVENVDFISIFRLLISNNHLLCVKTALKFYLNINKDNNIDQILDECKDRFSDSNEYDEFTEMLKKIYLEINTQ